MGMFDYVNLTDKCRKCNRRLGNFQSKDGECTLKRLEPSEVKNFYTACDHCHEWHEYRVTPARAFSIERVEKTGD